MDKNRVEGKIKQAEGKAQDIKGDVTGDLGEEAEGKVKQVAGKIQEEYGKAKDELRHEARKTRSEE